jgi:hypothetical protein
MRDHPKHKIAILNKQLSIDDTKQCRTMNKCICSSRI